MKTRHGVGRFFLEAREARPGAAALTGAPWKEVRHVVPGSGALPALSVQPWRAAFGYPGAGARALLVRGERAGGWRAGGAAR
ncbi:hypothetical protein [Sorangium sp. So ce131]|uniref:hypothetical protein n=1 Tax=Sorangium sp. So ce131 TaxID=3133282 RepID=UPI003F5E3376